MEFYEWVLSFCIFYFYGKLLVSEVVSDIDGGFVVRDVLEVVCGIGVIIVSLYEDFVWLWGLWLVVSDLLQIVVNMVWCVLSLKIQQYVLLLVDVDMVEFLFEDNSFDVIVCGFGLMFLLDKVCVVREFCCVLWLGGCVYVMMFYYNQFFEFICQ